MNKIYLFAIGLFFLGSSCGDFLEEKSQNLAFVETTKDLDELLIGNAFLQKNTNNDPPFFMWLDAMDDDVSQYIYTAPPTTTSSLMFVALENFYKWRDYPFDDDRPNYYAGGTGWTKMYSCIGILNVVLKEVERFSEEKDYRRLKGEALFLRGFYYFYLVNVWGHPYNAATASTDLGVPIKLTEYIEDKGFSRNTVEECYQQVVSDLKEAITYLKGVKLSFRRRASENAARALLARTYLYMGEYQAALNQCDSILEKSDGLAMYDMNGMTVSAFYTARRSVDSEECIFTNGYLPTFFQAGFIAFVVSNDLLNSYDAENDLRFRSGKDSHFFKYFKGNYLGYEQNGYWNVTSTSLTFPEVYLNRAEALAMLDRPEEAIAMLQELRKNRMTDVGTINLSGKDLVKFIREERRRELCFHGLRWFDLRRYAVHPKYPEKTRIEHPYYEWTGSMTLKKMYVLDEYPGDGGWLLPIPTDALKSNEGALEDNVRTERPE